MHSRWMLIVALLVVTAVSASAQTLPVASPVRTVEFTQAIEQAVARNPSVAQAATAVAQAEALLQQARAATMPNVSTGLTNITLDGARGFDGGVTQPQNQFAFTANANMPILAPAQWAAVSDRAESRPSRSP